MFDIGWTELLLIGIVALIVVGPKDLPGMFRALGKFTAKARRMARDFQRAMEEAADDSGVREAAADLKGMTNPKNMGLDALKGAADRFDKWEPGKTSKDFRAKAEKDKAEKDKAAKDQASKTPAGKTAGQTAAAKATAKTTARKTPSKPAKKAAPTSPSTSASTSASPDTPSSPEPKETGAS